MATRKSRWPLMLAMFLGIWATPFVRGEEPSSPFERNVAAMLITRCVGCHSGDEPKGGLDLTRHEGVLKGGKNGAAVIPGKPDESLLIDRVLQGTMPKK